MAKNRPAADRFRRNDPPAVIYVVNGMGARGTKLYFAKVTN